MGHIQLYPSTHIHSEGYPIDTHPNKIIFEIYWNLQVSPGVLMFGHSKAGKEMIEEAKLSGMAPNWSKRIPLRITQHELEK